LPARVSCPSAHTAQAEDAGETKLPAAIDEARTVRAGGRDAFPVLARVRQGR
jgi:hypothetical protein